MPRYTSLSSRNTSNICLPDRALHHLLGGGVDAPRPLSRGRSGQASPFAFFFYLFRLYWLKLETLNYSFAAWKTREGARCAITVVKFDGVMLEGFQGLSLIEFDTHLR